jgi:Ca2+:H+ antiporter
MVAAKTTKQQVHKLERILRVFLLFIPLAVAAEWLHWGALATFVLASVAIVPLAGVMGRATEQIAARLGAGVGGLLNATFGNAAELIIAFVALQRGLYDVVKASLTGSIIGNVLLVLGVAIFAGGLKRPSQKFDRAAAAANSTLLALAAIGLVVPAIFHPIAMSAVASNRVTPERERILESGLSLEIAAVLFVAYAASLLFSLRTHRHLYAGEAAEHAPLGFRMQACMTQANLNHSTIRSG